ncbi:hypothetical protein RUM43_014438 [Polyplax serrata]|uniref:Uncharacterized protein n=1 Tax=Polyplax serrata TaxID=468196 RepID=A0AAN8S6T3_POLSC
MSREIHRNCIRKVGTTEQDISSCQKGIIDRANEKQTCYLKCVLHEIALMDDNGKLTPVKALKVLPLNSLSKFGPIVAGCGKIEKEKRKSFLNSRVMPMYRIIRMSQMSTIKCPLMGSSVIERLTLFSAPARTHRLEFHSLAISSSSTTGFRCPDEQKK